jgi:hypothetical protein
MGAASGPLNGALRPPLAISAKDAVGLVAVSADILGETTDRSR